MWRKGNTCALFVVIQTGAATVEDSTGLPQKIKNGTALSPSNSTSGNISEGTQNTNSKEHKHPYIYCTIIYNRQDTEAVQVSISTWVEKQPWDVYRMVYYLAMKKKKVLPFATPWMDVENIMLSEISLSKKDKYHDFIHMWSLMSKLN